VLLASTGAGVGGREGPPHHGVFDISYRRPIPGLTIMAPKDENELQHMLFSALQYRRPVAIRYPRGSGLGVPLEQLLRYIPEGCAEIVRQAEPGVVIIAVGNMVQTALQAAAQLAEEGVEVSVVNARFIKPLDRGTILPLASTSRIFTVEDNALQGGFGSALMELFEEEGLSHLSVTRIGYPDSFIEQGEQAELYQRYGLTYVDIAARIKSALP